MKSTFNSERMINENSWSQAVLTTDNLAINPTETTVPESQIKNVYASFAKRMMAHNIDLLILIILFYTIGYFINNNTVFFTICLSITILYGGIFESSSWAATPGKKVMKLEVMKKNNQRLSFIQSLLRTCLKFFSFILLFIGYIHIFYSPLRQGLHDRIINNVVVFKG